MLVAALSVFWRVDGLIHSHALVHLAFDCDPDEARFHLRANAAHGAVFRATTR